MSTPFRDLVERVRVATDIARLVGEDVDLEPEGQVLKGFSPFNKETRPSFVVWPSTGTWKDFSGGGRLGGDVFSYVQARDEVGFKEAVFSLAARAGVQLPGEDDEAFHAQLGRLKERRRVEELLTIAARYYHVTLPAEIRRRYFEEGYGFSEETVDDLELGFADGKLWEHLTEEVGIDPEAAKRTGLFVVTKGGRVRDFFENRLVFPYWKGGRVVYFIARATHLTGDDPWEGSKYKKLLTRSERHGYVSEELQNDTFYNEDAARQAKTLLITEGVTDCISAMQAGFSCISPVTVRFRKRDAPKLLSLTRTAKKTVICNDAETSEAGIKGARETAEGLSREGRDVRILELPRPEGVEKVDLNEFLKNHPPAELETLVREAKHYIEHLIDEVPADTETAKLPERLRPVLEQIASRTAIEQERYTGLLAARLGSGKRTIKQMLKEMGRPPRKREHPESLPLPGIDDGLENLRGEVFEARNHYYIQPDKAPQRISSFHIEPRERIKMELGEMVIGDITTLSGAFYPRVPFPPTAFHAKRNFLAALPAMDTYWMGSDENLQGLMALFSKRKNLPKRRGTQVLGLLDTDEGPRWIAKDLVMGPAGVIEDSDIIFVSNGSTFPEVLKYRAAPEEEVRRVADRAFRALLEVNEPSVVLPVLGWFFAAPFKPRLMKLLGHFPILWVYGTKGSGKTSLCKEVFWRLFGVDSAESFSATETEFALIKLLSSTNAAPVFLDEYRPDDMPRHRLGTLHRMLRRIYSGEMEERGRADQSVNVYRLTAPVCIGGEARTDDPALVDRLVSVTPDNNRLHRHPEHVAAFKTLQTLDLGLLALPYVRFTLGRDLPEDLEVAAGLTARTLKEIPGGENVSFRCRDNLSVVVLGLIMFEAFAQSLCVDTPEIDLAAALAPSVEDLMDGEKGAKNQLDHFIETCSILAYNGLLQEDKHYAVINGLTCLHLRSCWEIFAEHQRKVGRTVDPSALRAMRRLIKENHQRDGYVKEIDKTVSMSGGRPRMLAVDLTQAAEFLEVEPFPKRTDRTWGGDRSWYGGYDE